MLRLQARNLRRLIPHLETLKVRLASWTVRWLQHHLKTVLRQMKVQALHLQKRALKQRSSVLRLRTLNLRGLIPHLETLKVRLESWMVHWLQHLLKRVLPQMRVQAHRQQKKALRQRN